MKALSEAFPKIKAVMVESIPYSADALRAYKQLVAQGASLLFATSNYGDFLYGVAKPSCEVGFHECDGRPGSRHLDADGPRRTSRAEISGLSIGRLV